MFQNEIYNFKTGLIIALQYEYEGSFEYKEIININNDKYYLLNNDIVLCFCGVGKANAARVATNLINLFNVKNIINLGSSCSINKNINVLDLHIPHSFQYLDVDVSCDNQLEHNQLPYEPKFFNANKDINNIIIQLLENNNIKSNSGIAGCIDSFITSSNAKKFGDVDNPKLYSIDMESTAIAQVCNHYNIKFNALKIISDVISFDNNDNYNDFEINMPKVAKLSRQILDLILKISFN